MDDAKNTNVKTILPLSSAAIRRARKADPNRGRCLVQDTYVDAVPQTAYPRFEMTKYRIERIEWAWNMSRGTLNLDTRRNMLFLKKNLRDLYRAKKWMLIPALEDVHHYMTLCGTQPDSPGKWSANSHDEFVDFPEGQTFKYRLVRVKDMESVVITRAEKSQSGNRTIRHKYRYPFEKLPLLTSHVHPKFIILHVHDIMRQLVKDEGKKVRTIREDFTDKYCPGETLMEDIHSLNLEWWADNWNKFTRDDDPFLPTRQEYNDSLAWPLDDDADGDSDSTLWRRPCKIEPFKRDDRYGPSCDKSDDAYETIVVYKGESTGIVAQAS